MYVGTRKIAATTPTSVFTRNRIGKESESKEVSWRHCEICESNFHPPFSQITSARQDRIGSNRIELRNPLCHLSGSGQMYCNHAFHYKCLVEMCRRQCRQSLECPIYRHKQPIKVQCEPIWSTLRPSRQLEQAIEM